MNGRCRSIYQLARNYADFTQVVAAESLNLSVRSLIDYELGKTIPNSDVVADMARLYKARWLGYEHLRISSRLGIEILPAINVEDIAKSVLVLQKESSDVDNIKNWMVDIACDGKVDKQEVNKWDQVAKEVFEMAGAALSVVYSR